MVFLGGGGICVIFGDDFVFLVDWLRCMSIYCLLDEAGVCFTKKIKAQFNKILPISKFSLQHIETRSNLAPSPIKLFQHRLSGVYGSGKGRFIFKLFSYNLDTILYFQKSIKYMYGLIINKNYDSTFIR